MAKKCFFCGSSDVVRNGMRDRKRLYKCNVSPARDSFWEVIARGKFQVITDYVEGKQTFEQLALKYGVNERTIRRICRICGISR